MRESTKRRLAFNRYLELGPGRSLERLATVLKQEAALASGKRVPSFRTPCRWSAALGWQDKLANLEREARQRDAEDHIGALLDMNERQATEGLLMQQKAMGRLRSIGEQELTPSEVARFAEIGVRIERLARGDVTDRTSMEKENDSELSGFSIEELRAIISYAKRGTTGPAGDRAKEPEQPA